MSDVTMADTQRLDVTPEERVHDNPSVQEIRQRLENAKGQDYWRGLDELADSDAFQEFMATEFPRQAAPLEASLRRRDFLKLLSEEDLEKLDAMPDPKPQPYFPEAIRQRTPTASNAARSTRVATIYHLANIAFRVGRTIRFDPDTEQILGDEEANRLVDQPMRTPWRL